MDLRTVFHGVASVMLVVGLTMLTAVPVGMVMGDTWAATRGLLECGLATVGFGALTALRGRRPPTFGLREGFAVVALGWMAASLFGALPFMVVGRLHWYDAVFEAMSGFTTTGASVLEQGLHLPAGGALSQGIADLSYGVIYWRSMTHWLGGMGIVVLAVALLPWLGLGTQQLFHAEAAPGPRGDRMTPRIADTAKALWGVYVLLCLLQTALLRFGGMSLFDAWCHTCGTMGTGGFSTRQESLAYYNSAYLDGVVTIFMFLAATNFALHYRALRGEWRSVWRDDELKFFLAVVLVASASVAFSLTDRELVTASVWTQPLCIASLPSSSST